MLLVPSGGIAEALSDGRVQSGDSTRADAASPGYSIVGYVVYSADEAMKAAITEREMVLEIMRIRGVVTSWVG